MERSEVREALIKQLTSKFHELEIKCEYLESCVLPSLDTKEASGELQLEIGAMKKQAKEAKQFLDYLTSCDK